MKVLLDNQFSPRFRHEFPFCDVETVAYRGRGAFGDDELLQRAESEFEVLSLIRALVGKLLCRYRWGPCDASGGIIFSNLSTYQ